VRALVDAGMDVARFNRSHGSFEEHEVAYAEVRKASLESGRAVGVLVDLQGPKIRTGRFAAGPVMLVNGERFTVTVDDILGDSERVSTTYKGLPGDVSPGDLLLIDDGKVTLMAVEVTATDVVTEVVEGGAVSNNKGINLPGVAVSVPALSEKDEADLRWALKLPADMVALSFVRDAKDIERVHEIMDEEGGERVYAVNTTQILGDDQGRVRALALVEVVPGDKGFVAVEGTEREIPAQLVLLAMGFLGPQATGVVEQLGVDLDERSNIRRDKAFMSSVPGVFVAGDAGRGQSLIVWAIAEGRSAAAGVDAYLMNHASALPRPLNPTDRPLTV
jgi:hypothetical protein